MDKLTAIKIKYIDGTYSDEIPLSVIAQSIDWDNNNTIVDILGNVEFSTKGSIQTQINNILAQKGSTNGIATLDSGGKVPSSQLPSYVDDVLEYSSRSAFPSTGESGKIYIALDTNLTYRWSGSAYVEISPSLALGETSSTAYRGDRGKTAYDHASAKGSAFTSGMYKITTNSEGHVTAATAITKSDITGLGIPSSDTNNRKAFYGTCDTSASTQTKVVTLSTSTGWELVAGTVVAVKFTYTNTYNSTTSSPCKLNVNNTGAKNIYYDNTATPTGANPLAFGRANCINQYVYDGTNWVWCGTSAAVFGSADNVSYDNTASGLTATDVQGAVDEVISDIDSLSASDIAYSNSSSGLSATKVQGAVDELNSNKIAYGEYNTVDLNTIKTAGMYGIQGSSTNVPSGTSFGCLEVFEYRRSVNNCYVQVFHGHNSGVYVGSFIRVSSQNGSTWSAWKKIMVKGDSIADSFTQETFSNSTTSLTSKTATEVTFDVSKSGKTAISISGVTVTYPNTVWVCSYYLDVAAQKAHVYVFNNGSNAATGVGVKCLYTTT